MPHPRKHLDLLGTQPRKSFSQNFLQSPHWIETLTASVLEGPETEEVWEIGPGLGALTEKLIEKHRGQLVVFEFDRKFAQRLRELYPTIQVVEGDFLKVDLKALLPEGKRVRLLSNLPYHISSPVLFKLLEYRQHFVHWVLTFQKEFAERLLAQPKSKAYGGLSVVVQEFLQMESLGVIPPGAFYPAPAVSSQAVRFFPSDRARVSESNLTSVVHSAFQHRRKKMSSNLSLDFEKPKVQAAMVQLSLLPTARAEELSVEHFVHLTQLLQTSVKTLH